MDIDRYKEIRENIINSINNVIRQYVNKPVRIRGNVCRGYNWKTETQYIEYSANICFLDENNNNIFGADIDIYFRNGLIEVRTGTMGSFTKENYGQYNKYLLLGEILKNIDNIENQIKDIIEPLKNEFNILEDQLRDKRRQQEKEEKEAKEQENRIKLENAEKECREIAEQKNLKISHKKLITVITQYGVQTRYNNWFEALDYVKNIKTK